MENINLGKFTLEEKVDLILTLLVSQGINTQEPAFGEAASRTTMYYLQDKSSYRLSMDLGIEKPLNYKENLVMTLLDTADAIRVIIANYTKDTNNFKKYKVKVTFAYQGYSHYDNTTAIKYHFEHMFRNTYDQNGRQDSSVFDYLSPTSGTTNSLTITNTVTKERCFFAIEELKDLVNAKIKWYDDGYLSEDLKKKVVDIISPTNGP